MDSYEEFLHLMRTKGYTIKGETLGENAPKYISFLPPGRERFMRGSVKSLGAEYTKERISRRITEKVQNRSKTLPGAYFRKHETELILYDGAKEMLRRANLDSRTLDLDKMYADFSQMKQKKTELLQKYKATENEIKQMEHELDKLKQYMSMRQNEAIAPTRFQEPDR